jgi:hypothetical protein
MSDQSNPPINTTRKYYEVPNGPPNKSPPNNLENKTG